METVCVTGRGFVRSEVEARRMPESVCEGLLPMCLHFSPPCTSPDSSCSPLSFTSTAQLCAVFRVTLSLSRLPCLIKKKKKTCSCPKKEKNWWFNTPHYVRQMGLCFFFSRTYTPTDEQWYVPV